MKHSTMARYLGNLLAGTGEDALRLLLLYGSRREGTDMDVLAVFEEEPSQSAFLVGRLDICTLSVRSLLSRSDALDPVVTEPLLTGDCVAGDRQLWGELVRRLQTAKPGDQAITYLLIQASQCHVSARVLLQAPCGRRSVHSALVHLSYAFTYRAFATHYAAVGGPAIRLSELLRLMPECDQSFWGVLQQLKRAGADLSPSAVQDLCRTYENTLVLHPETGSVQGYQGQQSAPADALPRAAER